jgi:hypothetical protein
MDGWMGRYTEKQVRRWMERQTHAYTYAHTSTATAENKFVNSPYTETFKDFLLMTVPVIFSPSENIKSSCTSCSLHDRPTIHLHEFLTSALDGGEWSASRPGHFTPRERAPGTHGIGGWVGPRAGPDAVVKRKVPSPRRKLNPDHPIVQPVA